MTGYLWRKFSTRNKRLVTAPLTSPAPWPTSAARAARRRPLAVTTESYRGSLRRDAAHRMAFIGPTQTGRLR